MTTNTNLQTKPFVYNKRKTKLTKKIFYKQSRGMIYKTKLNIN